MLLQHEATDLRCGPGWLEDKFCSTLTGNQAPCVGSSYDAPLSAQQPRSEAMGYPRRGHEHGRSGARGHVGQTRQGTFAAQVREFFPASGVCPALLAELLQQSILISMATGLAILSHVFKAQGHSSSTCLLGTRPPQPSAHRRPQHTSGLGDGSFRVQAQQLSESNPSEV